MTPRSSGGGSASTSSATRRWATSPAAATSASSPSRCSSGSSAPRSRPRPRSLLLEDIHWADGDSLDTICHLVEHLDDLPLLVVAAGRPTLDQRRPGWAAGPGTSRRIDLQPLSDADARGLVAEILRLVDDVPDALVDLAVAHSDGNPFYVEELVKTLLEEGVVQVASDGPWAVDLSRLRAVVGPADAVGCAPGQARRPPGR